jgi:hypothetical protein
MINVLTGFFLLGLVSLGPVSIPSAVADAGPDAVLIQLAETSQATESPYRLERALGAALDGGDALAALPRALVRGDVELSRFLRTLVRMQGTSGGVAELESTVADGAQRRMVEAAREEIASKTAGLDRELISVKSRLWNLERSPPGDGESGDIESGRTRNRPSVLMNLRFAISGLERELREWTSIARRLGGWCGG